MKILERIGEWIDIMYADYPFILGIFVANVLLWFGFLYF
jgi:hypothetical protein